MTVGPRGPLLVQDWQLFEKHAHFNRERIPERVVHAKGSAAYGTLTVTNDITKYTKANIFASVGKKTECLLRFSTVAGERGAADAERDVRGFALKFYTEEGNWDLVGNNIPVFFIQDAIKFPDLVHAVKMEPDRGFPQAATAHDTFWDYISLTPESMHMVMWIMSDRTIPRSLRMIEGFGVHSFRLVNDAGESTFVKFHWRPKLGLQSTVWDETVKISGADQDFHRRDMFDAIAARFGGLDIVVNNAAILRDRSVKKMSLEEWQSVIDTNLTGVFNVSRLAAERLNDGGRIVNLSSISAFEGFFGQANYAAAKAGVAAMTRVLARGLARRRITVNAVAPGVVLTEMGRSIPEEVRTEMLKSIPLGRFGAPTEIAGVILFLCSDLSSGITGEILFVDAGG